MKNSIKDLITEYNHRKSLAQEELEIKTHEIYTKIPRIKNIDMEMAALGIDLAKHVINNKNNIEDSVNDMKESIIDLKIEKGELLASNGYPVDYLTLKYRCRQCEDTGYIKGSKCLCLKQEIINTAYSQSNLSSIIKKENFDTFNLDLYSDKPYKKIKVSPRENMEAIYKDCMDFVSSFDVSDENLLFYGEPGLGKTFLANCIAKALLDKGKLVIYQTAFNLFDILRDYKFNADKEHFDKKQLDNLLYCDLLIIDDLGTEVNNSFISSELFNIINTRLLNRKKTIISTNLSLPQLKKNYSSRIISRILGNYNAMKFYGEDLRGKNI